MPNLFDKFQNYIPIRVNIKQQNNGDFLIVMGYSFELQYLNDTARFIYLNFDGKNTVLDIYNLILQEYEINEDMKETVKRDLINTIRDFQCQNIAKLRIKAVK